MVCFIIIGLLLLAYGVYRLYQHLNPSPNIDPRGKSVLISGCDTGFGNRLAYQLDQLGFRVYAGVFDEKNIETFKKNFSANSKAFRLDITKQSDIDAAYEMISRESPVLHALVNNAGIGAGGYIDWISLEFMRRMMDVNFFGHVAMTKKFLPLLVVKRDSRVVNICSVAGYLTKQGMSAYSASKYALEAFSDCLRREMSMWNLRVCIIEPGFMRTGIVEGHDKNLQKLWDGLTADVKERWGENQLKQQIQLTLDNVFIKNAEDPQKVVNDLKHAVMNSSPCIRYRPGWQSKYLMFPISQLPAWIADWILIRPSLRGEPPTGVRKQKAH